jgi:outer membrane protein TolC
MLTGLEELPAKVEESLSGMAEIGERHPFLAEAGAKITLAQGERNLAQLEKRENPQVMLNARRERGAFDSTSSSSVGLALRIPLDAPVRSAPLLAAAEMGLAQAMSERDQRTIVLQTMLHEATHNLEVTRDELSIVEEQHRLAQENLRLAKKAFDLGESDLVSLMRVQASAQEAERALRSRQTQLQWDIARYNQAVGVLP